MNKKIFPLLLSIVVLAVFGNQDAGAVANGNGSCDPNEVTKQECARFGANVIEFMGARPAICTVNVPPGPAPCTVYFYLYSGTATNQINVAIPLNLTQVLNDASEVNCTQYYTNGEGDPTTNFGKGLLTFGVCRTAPNAASLPVVNNPPSSYNMWIATDPSVFDKSMPLAWQVRQSKTEVYGGTLVGPVLAQAAVSESGATLTTKEGTSISYTFQGGEVTITGGQGDVIPMDQTKLCLPTGFNTPTFYANGDPQKPYWCENISYVTEQCDVKTTGADPCRYVGGYCIRY